MNESIKNIGGKEATALTEEQKARFIAARTDEAVRNALATENQNLIHTVFKKEFPNIYTSEKDVLFNDGFLGLMKAVEKFDPNVGTAFSTFAWEYIKGYLMNALTDDKSILDIPRETVKKELKRSKQISKHRQGRDITNTEAAEQLGLSATSALPSEQSLSDTLNTTSSTEVGDLIKDEKTPSPEIIELARAELGSLETLIEKVLAQVETNAEQLIFFSKYIDHLSRIDTSKKLPSARGIAKKRGLQQHQPSKILENFWRKVRSKFMEETKDANIDENWFFGLLRRRDQLHELLNLEEKPYFLPVERIIKSIIAELREGQEKKVFFGRYGEHIKQINASKKLPSYADVEKIEGLKPRQAGKILTSFWRRVRYKFKEETDNANINENWFFGLLHERNQLRTNVVEDLDDNNSS